MPKDRMGVSVTEVPGESGAGGEDGDQTLSRFFFETERSSFILAAVIKYHCRNSLRRKSYSGLEF